MRALGMLVPLILNLFRQFVWSGTRRTKFGIKRSTTPGSLDNQNWLFQLFLHVDSEGEFRADLTAQLSRIVSSFTKAGSQFPQTLAIGAAIIRPCQIRHPDIVAHSWRTIGITHLLENRGSQRILADIVKGANFGMSLHVGLASEDEDLERLGEGERR